MTLNVAAYKRSLYPLAVQAPDEDTAQAAIPPGFRRFVLHWNSSKVKGKNPIRKNDWQECQGVLFSDHTGIALSNGLRFETLSELEYMLNVSGEHRIDWLDV